MKKAIITIGREFGSGGRLIGKRLAEDLGIPFYDKEIIDLSAKKSGLSPDFIASSDERAPSAFSFGISPTIGDTIGYFMQYDAPASDRAYLAQTAVINELAEKESCVIVGRGSGFILRDHPDRVSLLFYAPLDDRIRRAAEEYGLDEPGLADKIIKVDKTRSNFIKRYTGENWMDARSYDLCINTSKLGIEGSVAAVKEYLAHR